jgi:hypothetical protein
VGYSWAHINIFVENKKILCCLHFWRVIGQEFGLDFLWDVGEYVIIMV